MGSCPRTRRKVIVHQGAAGLALAREVAAAGQGHVPGAAPDPDAGPGPASALTAVAAGQGLGHVTAGGLGAAGRDVDPGTARDPGPVAAALCREIARPPPVAASVGHAPGLVSALPRDPKIRNETARVEVLASVLEARARASLPLCLRRPSPNPEPEVRAALFLAGALPLLGNPAPGKPRALSRASYRGLRHAKPQGLRHAKPQGPRHAKVHGPLHGRLLHLQDAKLRDHLHENRDRLDVNRALLDENRYLRDANQYLQDANRDLPKDHYRGLQDVKLRHPAASQVPALSPLLGGRGRDLPPGEAVSPPSLLLVKCVLVPHLNYFLELQNLESFLAKCLDLEILDFNALYRITS